MQVCELACYHNPLRLRHAWSYFISRHHCHCLKDCKILHEAGDSNEGGLFVVRSESKISKNGTRHGVLMIFAPIMSYMYMHCKAVQAETFGWFC